MRLLLLSCFFNLVLFGRISASNLPLNHPPGCDTLVTTDGNIYFVHVEWQNDREVHYTRCNSESGGMYGLPMHKVREIKLYKGPPVAEKIVMPPRIIPSVPLIAEKEQFVWDTFDLLTLNNGQKLRILLLEHDYLNLYYRLYDDPADDREYCVPNERIRSLLIAKSHRKAKRKGSRGVAVLVAIAAIFLLIIL